MFKVGKYYTKKDIYSILNVPPSKQKGAWDTGYREYKGEIFIFINIGVEGRTGHNYKNFWHGDLLYWQAKNNSNIKQPLIKKILNQSIKKHIFTRTDNKDPFIYEGLGNVKEFKDTTPVEIVWSFEYSSRPEKLAEEIFLKNLSEGKHQKILVNSYERNPYARRLCIKDFGTKCYICGFNFEEKYGEIGKGFIQVHHIIPLSEIGEKYIIDPIKDLIPICPNCHAMIHRRNPPFSPKELKRILRTNNG